MTLQPTATQAPAAQAPVATASAGLLLVALHVDEPVTGSFRHTSGPLAQALNLGWVPRLRPRREHFRDLIHPHWVKTAPDGTR